MDTKLEIKEYEGRGLYYYRSGPHTVNESYGGVPVVGRWVREGFNPIKILWWTPEFSISKSYIAQLQNGSYAVGRQGMNNCWYGCNSTDSVLGDFSRASEILELKVGVANKRYFTGAVLEFCIGWLVVIALLYVSYKYR